MSGTTIIISCMDRRLNKILDSMNSGDDKRVFLRNAGAAVPGLERTIRYAIDNGNVSELLLVAHTDCGAMGYVYNAIKNGKDGLHAGLVSQFDKASFASRLELEQLNEKRQKEALERMFGNKGIRISSRLVELSESADNGKKHILVVTKTSTKKYADIADAIGENAEDCYFIQANDIEEVIPDIAVGTDLLGIKDVRLAALESSQYRQVQNDFERLKARGVESKAKLSMIRLDL
ncbi:MAG: carbonic anhydrase [Candidatus Micrarchaeia archaeon]